MNTHRLLVIKYAIILCFLVVLVRLYYWQIIMSDSLKAQAESQYNSVQKLLASRGKIVTADGYVLATNQEVYTVFAEPKRTKEHAREMADALTPLLLPSVESHQATDSAYIKTLELETHDDLLQKLEKTENSWIALRRKVTKDIKEQIQQLGYKGIGFDPQEIRYYPEASMSAQLLGFVGSDELGNPKGYFGIEGQYNRELEGRSGFIKQEKDALGLPIAIGGFDAISSRNGRDVVLTIRRDIQFLLEEKLKEGMEKYGAKDAEGVIMNPKTGEILAMAAYPQYDPKAFYTYDQSLYKNPVVNDVYEPGSTLKILTVAAGVDSGAIKPDTLCTDPCAGPREISGYTIRTWNNEYNPGETMTDALAHSDNTAMIYISDLVGKDKFVSYLQAFGMGESTHIDLQDEAVPPFKKDWKPIDIATASFGQGISITGIQMVSIAQVIANKGMLMKPMVVKEVKDNITVIPVEAKEIRQVISPETAKTVTEMMIHSVDVGDARWAKPKGYIIAGKTGTAQIPVAGHYDDKKTIASFVGFAPAHDPQFVMLIKLREPSSSQWGSETAAPLWFSIAKDLLIKMNIPPSNSI